MSRFHVSENTGFSPTGKAREMKDIQLRLIKVIGTTTDCVNAFDTLPSTFACSAGSAAVLSRVDETFNITQQLFRARPNALPINASLSYYNPATPPGASSKSRRRSPLKDGIIYNSLLDCPSNSPSPVKANNKSREITCVSLSRRGNLMAVGEVIRPAPGFAIFN